LEVPALPRPQQLLVPAHRFLAGAVPRIIPYVVTAVLVALTGVIAEFLHLAHASVLFFLAVLASAWQGGIGPSLFSSVLSVLVLTCFFFQPRYSFALTAEGFFELLIFALIATLISNVVAERRKANLELAKLGSEFDQRVQERTAELKEANQRLEREIEARSRAQHELARSNSELELFARVIGHDIRAPLRVIRSSAMELKRLQGGERATEFLAHIQATAEHIDAFISGVLAFARVNTGRPVLTENVPMEAALQWALLNLKLTIEQTQAAVTHGPLPNVRGNQAQIAELLQNLISNALTYRGKERPRIYVSARSDGGDYVFSVSDNGIGIPPEYHASIFEAFKRLHSDREYPGSGLGLAISRKIVERHGGRIWVESKPGSGAAFYFTLESSQQQTATVGAPSLQDSPRPSHRLP
jgi:signal transduction histidine kinase